MDPREALLSNIAAAAILKAYLDQQQVSEAYIPPTITEWPPVTHISHVSSWLHSQPHIAIHGVPCPYPHLLNAFTLVHAMCDLCHPSMATCPYLHLAYTLSLTLYVLTPLSTAVHTYTYLHIAFYNGIFICPISGPYPPPVIYNDGWGDISLRNLLLI